MRENNSKNSQAYCGYVTILGRPNVGKSTLLNNLIGQKLSITSRKPQTTRRHTIGVNTDGNYQIIYIDTPGMQESPKNAMNRYMNKEATNALAGIDILIYVVEALKWTALDEHILNLLKDKTAPIILVINKIDKALLRLDDGEYGYCDETGEDIGLARLEARPIATLSLDAQERWELRQKQMGDSR